MMVKVADWFLNKNFSQNERYVIITSNSASVERETEKAVFVCFKGDFGTFKTWLPKSAATVVEDIDLPVKDIEVGTEVEHKTFGRGIVTDSSNGICTVKFGKVTKRIIATALAAV